MTVDVRVWKDLLCEAITTRVDEISCDECYSQLDRYAELVVQGSEAALIMPRVRDHIDHCRECRVEYQALEAALRGTARHFPPHLGGTAA
jgi:hypothetical protein